MATGFGVGHQLKSFVTIYARSHARYALIGTSQHRGCVKIGRMTRHCFFPTKEIKWILHTFSEAAIVLNCGGAMPETWASQAFDTAGELLEQCTSALKIHAFSHVCPLKWSDAELFYQKTAVPPIASVKT